VAGAGRQADAKTLKKPTMRFIAGLATLLSLLAFASGASAHASLVSAAPADGSVLVSAPKMMQLQFNESVVPAVIHLIDAEGRTRDDTSVRAVGEAILITLPERLPDGTQILSYRVISQDGHPVGGSLLFSIGAVTRTAGEEPRHRRIVDALIWLTRIGVYLGLFAGIGGVFFCAWIGPGAGGSKLIPGALVVGLVGAVASLGLQGIDLLDLPLGRLATSAPWSSALATSLGPSLLIAVVAMSTALATRLSASIRIARMLSAAAMAGVGLALAATGHAATAPPQWLMRPALFLHGIAVAYWIGALAPLAALTWRRADSLLPTLRRFSNLAIPVVALLVLTGVVLAVVQLESFHALITTDYGLLLLVKTSLVIVLLGLAALNRLYFTPKLVSDPTETRPLVRSILAECVIALGILAVVAGWRFTPPPRLLVNAETKPLAIHIHTEKAMFQVLISPAIVGADSFVLQLMTGDGSPLTAKETTLTLSLPARGIEPMARAAQLGADGYWHVRNAVLPVAGRWHMRIEALVTDFEKVALEDDFDLRDR
jgi:copper transport protein